MIIGYTTGVFDMFHVGHLNILKRSKSICDFLIVGVTTDEFVKQYKNKKTVIPFDERVEILKSIKYVDKVVPQENHDKILAWKSNKFDIMTVGDDWKGTKKWKSFEEKFSKLGVKIIYFPRTVGTSSTFLKNHLLKN
jgi:glycerol-3-phosphate cytidylyltransferase